MRGMQPAFPCVIECVIETHVHAQCIAVTWTNDQHASEVTALPVEAGEVSPETGGADQRAAGDQRVAGDRDQPGEWGRRRAAGRRTSRGPSVCGR